MILLTIYKNGLALAKSTKPAKKMLSWSRFCPKL